MPRHLAHSPSSPSRTPTSLPTQPRARAVLLGACAAFAAATGAAPAQSNLEARPAHFARAEGPTGDTAVIGDTQSFGRVLQVHEQLSAGTIKSLAFRLDHGTTAPAYTILADVWCSTAATTAEKPLAQFDQNHGGDRLRTVSLKMVQFPAAERRVPVADRFTHVIPFDAPFVFGGNGLLCWEILLHGTTTLAPVQFDAVAGTDDRPPPLQTQVGAGCRTSGSSYAAPFRLVCTPTIDWPNYTIDMALNASAGPASQLATLLLGLRFDAVGGVPLPFEIPGSGAASSQRCLVHVAPDAAMPTLIKSDGSLTLQLQSFLWPHVLGVDLGFQLVAQDAGANPTGLVTSDAVAMRFVTPYPPQPVGQVIAAGAHAATGAVHANAGLITAFGY